MCGGEFSVEKQQRCSQNLLFWIDVEHFERQKPVIKHIFEVLEKDTTEFSVRDRIVVKDLIMINRKKTAKEIVKRYIKSEKKHERDICTLSSGFSGWFSTPFLLGTQLSHSS